MRTLGHFKVTVRKDVLLQALRDNLKKHNDEFEVSMRGYQNLCVKELRRRASHIKRGQAGSASRWMMFSMRPPVSHERDYQQLIEMLELAQEETFEIDGAQFRQWVKDEWDWKDEFESSKNLYMSHS